MPKLRTTFLAGVAALALAGSAGLALADPADSHVMTVQLPDGGIANIHYRGDVPPTVTLAPQAVPVAFPAMFLESPFAMLDRVSAEMDRMAAQLWQQARIGPMPGGGFGFAAGLSGDGVCVRSVSITARGDGSQPEVVSHQSGNCGAMGGPATPSDQPVVPGHKAGTIQVKAQEPPAPARAAWRG